MDESQLRRNFYADIPINKTEVKYLEVTVDPVKHTITAERCERKKNSKETAYEITQYKVSKIMDLDNVVATLTANDTLEIKAPYGKEMKKPARVIPIVHANEPYSAISTFKYVDTQNAVVPHPAIDLFYTRVFGNEERELAKLGDDYYYCSFIF